jgi:hypothetical protein
MIAGETVMGAMAAMVTVTAVTVVVTEIAQETDTGQIPAVEGNGVLRHTTTATSDGVPTILHRGFMRRNHYVLGVPGIMKNGDGSRDCVACRLRQVLAFVILHI